MDRIIRAVLRHRRHIPWITAVVVLASLLLIPLATINYDLRAYLPADSMTSQAAEQMEDTFGLQATTLVLSGPTTLPEALELKARLAAVAGVASVEFLDDAADPLRPLSGLPQTVVGQYWRDGHALFRVTFAGSEYEASTQTAMRELRAVAGEDAAIAGGAARTVNMIRSVGRELGLILAFVLPVFLVILGAFTHSAVEAGLFLLVTGVAVAVNMGTNFLFPSISFMTHLSASVLQLAVSMDYSIFLLHRFNEERLRTPDTDAAMAQAVCSSLPVIAASALTTVVGFLSLALMRYTLGRDIGLVLTKGILLSLASVVFLLPPLALLCLRGIDRTGHRTLLPSFRRLGGMTLRIRWILIPVWLLVACVAFLAQGANRFSYSESAILSGKGSRVESDTLAVEARFGPENPIAILIRDPGPAAEAALAADLAALPAVLSVRSPAALADPLLPRSLLPEELMASFRTDGWLRLMVTVATDEESDAAFRASEAVQAVVDAHTGGEGIILGATQGVKEIRDVVESDYAVVTLVSILAVLLILWFTFRSAILPFLLVLVIESAVWINMGVPYFNGTTLSFVGYLIVGAIQLGATIDYAILLTSRHIEVRLRAGRGEAIRESVRLAGPSILTSSGIMTAAGLVVATVSRIEGIREIGRLIGRGSAVSALLVLTVLPLLLYVLDRPVTATTRVFRRQAGDRHRVSTENNPQESVTLHPERTETV